MSNPDQTNTNPAAAIIVSKGLSSSELQTRVAAKIVTSAPQVIDKVVDVLVGKEIDKRATALLGGIELATTLKRDFAKIDRPDIAATLDRSGKAIGEGSYTPARLKEIKKLDEKIKKVEKALEAATREDKPDFALLYDLKSEMDKADKDNASESAE